jgi:ABC-type branched-subunit amino acid transport system substrate-binding protein/TolA-binding protein
MTLNSIPYIKKAIAALIAVMAFFVFSCERRIVIEESPIKKTTPEKVEVYHFAMAEHYWNEKNYDKALMAYDRYLTKFPQGDRVKEAKTRKANIYYKKGIFDKALPLFLEVIDKYPTERRAEIHFLLSKTYFHLKRYPESRLSALRWLELYKYYPGKEDLYYLLGQNLIELNENARAFYWWLKSIESPHISPEKRENISHRLLEIIFQAKESELKEMAVYSKESDFINPIYYRLSMDYLFSERLDEAREAAIKVVGSAPDGEWAFKAREVLNKIDERLQADPNVIGCLLPLSGPFSIYGQEVLNGLELGLDVFQETDERLSLLELAIRDTQGDPEIAIKGLRELAENEKVIINIGPLISKVAKNVAEKAQEFGVPNITLSQQEDITETGNMVFQNCLTPDDQIKSLSDKVILEMGLRKFAILYPANAYGRYFMNKFWDEVESSGGEITAVESYNTKETDFAAEIKKMVGLFYPRPELDMEIEDLMVSSKETAESEEELEPIIDFDAVFIPDSYERVALLASQLAYYDVKGVNLLGTNLWNSPKLIEIGGKYVRRSIFPSGFFAQSKDKNVKYFVEQYRSFFGEDPGFLAAIGYDTIRIIKEILKENRANLRTREDLRSALTESSTFDSVTGQMVFDNKRRAKRTPILLTIVGNQFFPMP